MNHQRKSDSVIKGVISNLFPNVFFLQKKNIYYITLNRRIYAPRNSFQLIFEYVSDLGTPGRSVHKKVTSCYDCLTNLTFKCTAKYVSNYQQQHYNRFKFETEDTLDIAVSGHIIALNVVLSKLNSLLMFLVGSLSLFTVIKGSYKSLI